ncbi:MAG: hypothetical protein A2V85_11815 [Chloroflexi bacterium RBG_16_72_14]|nr:MAG: hypothetical protein A2V85_11815 [Chloroflexi bacterium RBG_16_72_14]
MQVPSQTTSSIVGTAARARMPVPVPSRPLRSRQARTRSMNTASSLTSREPYDSRCQVPNCAAWVPANAANGMPPTPPASRRSKASTESRTTARSRTPLRSRSNDSPTSPGNASGE